MKLFDENINWAKRYSASLAYRMHLQPVDRDAAINSGLFGLWEATKRFDPNRGKKFKAFACSRIIGEIIDQQRDSRSKFRRNVKFVPLRDVGRSHYFREDSFDDLLKLIPDHKCRFVCALRLRDGLLVKDIAKILKVSAPRVVHIYKRGLAEARAKLMVGPAGIAPATPSISVMCSTV